MNNKLFTLVLLFLGLFMASLIFRNGDLIWLAFPFLVYIGVGLLQAPAVDGIRLHAQRRIGQGVSGDDRVLEVEVQLRNQGENLPCLELVDDAPEGEKINAGRRELRAAVARGGEVFLKYSFLRKRGRYAWKTIRARAGDSLGLFTAELSLPAQAEIAVQPEHENFRRLALGPQRTLRAPGSISARQAGTGTDFWGVRLYQPGDSLRWLDWRRNARHPGRLFTKEFEREEMADIGLILDARRETDLRVGEDSLLEHSVQATACLADGFIHQGQRVGLLVLSKTIAQVFPGYGKHHLNRILDCLSGIKSSTSGRIIGLHYLPLRMFSSSALLVVLSPLARTDRPFFPRLRADGFQGLLISPDPYDFACSTIPREPVHQQALWLARQERRIRLQAIARLQIQVVDWQVSQPLYPQLQTAFRRSRGQRAHGERYGP